MKKALFTFAIVLIAVAAQAQLKVHDDGQISIGSLTKAYGVQVEPNCYVYFRTLNTTQPYGWGVNSISNLLTEKHWIVTDRDNTSNTYGEQVFYVSGNGTVWARNHFTYGTQPTVLRTGEPIDKERALSSILQLQGYFYEEASTVSPEGIMGSEYVKEEAKEAMVEDLQKRNIGLDAALLGDICPDAVRTDPEARLCINYNAIITMLVEAVKQQQEEIELLRQTMEDNGLMEPKKP